jgi:hypothetical protein
VVVPLGYPWGSHGNGHFTDNSDVLAVVSVFEQERNPAFEAWYLQVEEALGQQYHRYRNIAIPDECDK